MIFSAIFRFAFGPAGIAGGAAGTAVQVAMNTIQNGCKRGFFSNEAGLGSSAIDLSTGLVNAGVNDATIVAQAFGNVQGKPGEWFVVLVITHFAFTTVMGWFYYGAKVTEYLFGVTAGRIYRLIFIALIVLGRSELERIRIQKKGNR